MDEIQTALGKVKLANKLDCGTNDLSTKEINCPKHRVGMVIGKNGSMIKQIQDSCKVSMDVDKDTYKISITGSEASLERAMKEIEIIIRMEEEEINIGKSVLNYLLAKYVTVLHQLREEYQGAHIDVSRTGGKLLIRGNSEQLKEIKAKISGLDITSKERQLVGREFNVILGKKGATIDRLCSEHSVSIEVGNVNDGVSTATFTGPPSVVEAVLNDVEELMNDNREVVEVINISIITKNILLAESGRHIKAIQSRIVEGIPNGNCYVSVNKDHIAKDHPELLVKAKQSVISEALQFAHDVMKEFDGLFVKFTVDPYVIPRLIGKGGETIRKMTGGKPAFVEVDRVSGEISYGATTVELLDEVRKEIEEVIDNNSVLRIKSHPDILKRQYRELSRAGIKNELNGIVWLDIDENDSCYIVRGKKQDLDKGKAAIEDYIVNNQFDEVPITDEDREALLVGGKTSKIVQFSEDIGVKLQIDRGRFCVVVRGPQDKVEEAVKKINQYLNGGDGNSVAKLTVTEQVVGIIIGKGGKTRQQLEQKYNGVKINISRTHVVTIRGPDQAVADCRIEVGKMVASARVIQNITISDEQKESLEKKEYIKKIGPQIPVGLSIVDDKVVVKGTFHDVRDAMSLLNEMLTGEYKIYIELDASQFIKVRNTARDQSHFERMTTECGAKVELDLTAGSISISGKRSNVKRAKDQVYRFLDFILPNEISRVKITKPLFMSVGQASALAQISAEAGGVTVYLDRDLSLIVLRSIDEEKVKKARELIKQKIELAERLAYVLEVSASDSWILPVIIGKNGSKVSLLRSKYKGCRIDVSKESRTITIVGESEAIVLEVREAVLAAIETARSENAFVFIPNTYVPQFVGKGGSHVKELSAKYEVEIQRVKKGLHNFNIGGEASKVKTAKEAIDTWLVTQEKANATLTLSLEKERDAAVVIGQKGVVARSIEEDYKCRIDVDKKTLVVTVKGGSEDQREAAVNKMKELVAKDREETIARQVLAKEKKKDNAEQVAVDYDTKSNDQISKCDGSDVLKAEEDDKKPPSNQFPTKPVGIAKTPKNGNGKKKKKNKVDTSVNEGTEAGKNLFAMLLSQD
jgi:rRNA processing protein Krr1/Pno1